MAPPIHTLDLHFHDEPQTIAAYLIEHDDGGVLVETGPGSTTAMLQARLAEHGLTPSDVTDVLVTHIHLDHAGAAGWLAQHGATVHVHHVGAPHLRNPEKLWTSATRIYGDDMERLWGDIVPVPEAQLIELNDGDDITIGGLRFIALDTPGHAYHHMAFVLEGVCFTGDVGGVRIPGHEHVSLPLAPPEIRLDLWRDSIDTLREADIDRLMPTHFGPYDDVGAHLDRLESGIRTAERWLPEALADDPSDAEWRERVVDWMRQHAAEDGVSDADWALYETANPSWMAAMGLRRYWTKYGAEATG